MAFAISLDWVLGTGTGGGVRQSIQLGQPLTRPKV